MAFLVCYSQVVEDHAQDPRQTAAYLPQSFYERIFAVCRPDPRTFPVLGRIAKLRYESPPLLVQGAELPQLVRELSALEQGAEGVGDLRAAVESAMARRCSLTISGDMHAELGGAPRRAGGIGRRAWWRFW